MMWSQLIAKPLQSKTKYTKHIRNKIKPYPLGCKNTRITLQQQRRINLKEALFYYGKCSVYPSFGGEMSRLMNILGYSSWEWGT